jgi:hypothetical protein
MHWKAMLPAPAADAREAATTGIVMEAARATAIAGVLRRIGFS